MEKQRHYDDLYLLIADDDKDNLFIAEYTLSSQLGFSNVAGVEDGTHTLNYLSEHPEIDILLLDLMMPDMTGIEVMEALDITRSQHQLQNKDMLVIFQTGKVSNEDVMNCINAGAYYLVRKPYEGADLHKILDPLCKTVRRRKALFQALDKRLAEHTHETNPTPLSHANITTPSEAVQTAIEFAIQFPDPTNVMLPILCLITNAFEHGNLGINEEDKLKLIQSDDYYASLDALYNQSKAAKSRIVEVDIEQTPTETLLMVQDEGKGFVPGDYKHMTPTRVVKPYGRGIAFATACFDKIEYLGCGNKVVCTLETLSRQ